MRYRRARAKGATYFFTVVTYGRKQILCHGENVVLLRQVFRHVIDRHPFVIDAFVLLPEHLHCIWTLPQGDSDFSTRWRLIKGEFSRKCQNKYKSRTTVSRSIKKEQTIWQRRFWEHLMRNETDYAKHVDYIHYNPVKHGIVKAPKDWEYSSFHRAVRRGLYHPDWGAGGEVTFAKSIGQE